MVQTEEHQLEATKRRQHRLIIRSRRRVTKVSRPLSRQRNAGSPTIEAAAHSTQPAATERFRVDHGKGLTIHLVQRNLIISGTDQLRPSTLAPTEYLPLFNTHSVNDGKSHAELTLTSPTTTTTVKSDGIKMITSHIGEQTLLQVTDRETDQTHGYMSQASSFNEYLRRQRHRMSHCK